MQPKDESRTFIREWVPGTNIGAYLISATIEAVKPESTQPVQRAHIVAADDAFPTAMWHNSVCFAYALCC